MKSRVVIGLVLCAGVGIASIFNQEQNAMAEPAAKGEKMLGHMVYFSLHDPTDANRQKLIDACKKYLADHPGTVFFAVGGVSDLNREVNDRDWDVALQLVFKNRAAHDTYQDAPKHVEFINENKSLWKKVRVFDADVEGA
jgi:hypothetical protein